MIHAKCVTIMPEDFVLAARMVCSGREVLKDYKHAQKSCKSNKKSQLWGITVNYVLLKHLDSNIDSIKLILKITATVCFFFTSEYS